jgi:hypothetical protein
VLLRPIFLRTRALVAACQKPLMQDQQLHQEQYPVRSKFSVLTVNSGQATVITLCFISLQAFEADKKHSSTQVGALVDGCQHRARGEITSTRIESDDAPNNLAYRFSFSTINSGPVNRDMTIDIPPPGTEKLPNEGGPCRGGLYASTLRPISFKPAWLHLAYLCHSQDRSTRCLS